MRAFLVAVILFAATAVFGAEAPPTLRELQLEKELVEARMQLTVQQYQNLVKRQQELTAEIKKREAPAGKRPEDHPGRK